MDNLTKIKELLEQSQLRQGQELVDAQADLSDAGQQQQTAGLKDAGAKLLAALIKRGQDPILYNRMQDLGQPHKTVSVGEGVSVNGNPFSEAAAGGVRSAQQRLEEIKAKMADNVRQRIGLAGQLDEAARNARKFAADQAYQGEMLGLKKQQLANDAKSKNAYASMVDQLNFENKRLQNQKLERDLNSPPPRELPLDDRKVVEGLAGKVASKESIASQIEAYIDEVQKAKDEGNEKKALQLGRQMIKVLNSSEGADAVGSEEVTRLGGKLEFALGNLFNSNPTQFGRDIPGFIEDARGTLNAVRSANQTNQKIIDEKMGRKPVQSQPAPHGDIVEQDGVTYRWDGSQYVPQ